MQKILMLLVVSGLLGAMFAPNGFFTGHRTVILDPEITVRTPEVHIEGDRQLSKATIKGRISTSRAMPVSGAMITAFSSDQKRRISVYSHPDGSYELPVTFTGELTVRVRTPYFEDSIQDVNVEDAEIAQLDFNTERLSTTEELSSSLTASAHAAALKWNDPDIRVTFVSQCIYCHQIGNAITRRPRSKEQWDEVVGRMEGYMLLLTEDEKGGIAEELHEGFDGEPIAAVQTWDVSADLPNAIIEEWVSGDALSFIHDADVGQDGRLYGVDEGHDVIWELDRESGHVEVVNLPDVDLPVGGKFSGLALPIGVFTGSHGPHSLAEGRDGRFWITGALSSRLMAYQAKTHAFETFDVGADSLYPHTIRLDKTDRIWFTIAVSNQVARFDPATNQLDLLDLPSNGFSRWLSDAMTPTLMYVGSFFPRSNLPLKLSHHKLAKVGRSIMNLPYGIDINPVDGGVWYSKLYANRIGRIDAGTFEISEYEVPGNAGPRRPRFAPNGILWIPGFDSGTLFSFNPTTEEFTAYPLPTLAPGEIEAPYALNVHPDTGIVWITSNMSDRIFSFDPKTKKFTSYPLPIRGSYLRDLVFTEDGKICSSHSNLPAYAIEGGLAGFICLDPDKNSQ